MTTTHVGTKASTVDRRSPFVAYFQDHPWLISAAILLILLGGYILLRFMIADEEAPIRVKNGSLELYLEDMSQEWEPIGGSGMFRVMDKGRSSNLFAITIVPASSHTCSGAVSATQPYVRLTYHTDSPAADRTITLDTPSHFTRVNPGTGVTLSSPQPYQLIYNTTGYLKEIAAGPNAGLATVMCSFSSREQLDYIQIKNP